MSGESYTDLISGGPIQTYVHGINVQTSASTITLTFPADRIQKINFTAGSQKLRLPAASNYSDGQDFVVVNAGANAFTIWTNDGTTQNIGTASVGSSYYVYLISRADADDSEGTWGMNAFGGGGASTGANSDITSLSGLTTPLSPFQGGTGVQNDNAKTITLGGALVTTGGDDVTFTTPGFDVNVNLPQAGNLATENGSNSIGGRLSNYLSYNKVTITTPASNATLTLANGSTLATSGAFSSTLTFTALTAVTFPTTGTLATTAGTKRQQNFSSGSVAGGVTQYMGAGAATSATEAQVNSVAAVAFTAQNLYVKASTAPTGSETFVYTLRKNGSDTALTVTVTAAATTGSDTTHSATFAAGDLYDLKLVTSGGAATAYHNCAMEFAA